MARDHMSENKKDTSQRSQHSGGQFQAGSEQARMAGRKIAEAQPIEAKRRGGENSRRGS